MHSSDCVFCKIVEGKIPSERIAESTNFVAMLDIAPVAPGHTLIVPKGHSTNLLEMHEALGNEFLAFTQQVTQAILATTGAEGCNHIANTGASSGQVVFHTHLHVIPRKTGDGLQIGFDHHVRSTPEELAALRAKIVTHLR